MTEKILTRNVRGASRRPLGAYIKDLVAEHDMHILIMLDTKTTAQNAMSILSILHALYPSSVLRFGNGASGSIWVFWDSAQVTLSPLDSIDQHVLFHQASVWQIETFLPLDGLCVTKLSSLHPVMARIKIDGNLTRHRS